MGKKNGAGTSAVVDSLEFGDEQRYAISSYGAEYPFEVLVQRLERGDIVVPPFQRGYVWKISQASKFVESLLLGLPVPGIFLYKDPDTKKLVVVDGQQRLETLSRFASGSFKERTFSLKGVCKEFEGATFKSLGEADRRTLNDSMLHATIFQQDDPSDGGSSVYQIFKRLNTGGTPLNSQEIRECVFQGTFLDRLKLMAKRESWKQLLGPRSRGTDRAHVLRFLALHANWQSYDRPMESFLNKFLSHHRRATEKTLDQFEKDFGATVDFAVEHLKPETFRPARAFNVAVADALLVAVTERLAAGPIRHPDRLLPAAIALRDSPPFRAYWESQTNTKDYVLGRIGGMIDAFKKIR